MDDDIKTEFNRSLKVWAHESVVDNSEELVLFCDLYNSGEVGNRQKRIGRCLCKDGLCLRQECFLNVSGISHIYKGVPEAPTLE